MIKKITALILCLALCISVCGVFAADDDGSYGNRNNS